MFNIFIDKINAIIYTQMLKTPHDLIFHLLYLEYKIMRGLKHLGINDSIYLVYKYVKHELN